MMGDFDGYGFRKTTEDDLKPQPSSKKVMVTLSKAEQESIAAFAVSSLNISEFFAGIENRDKVTEGQYAVVERWRGWYPRVVAGLPVKNKYPGCWIKGCKKKATVVFDHVAYCADDAIVASKKKAPQ